MSVLSSWVRGLFKTNIGLNLTQVALEIPAADYEEDSVFANFKIFDELPELLIKAFGGEKELQRAVGKLNVSNIMNDIYYSVVNNTFETYFSASGNVVKNEVFKDRRLTISFLPILYENTNVFTDRKRSDLVWAILLDIPGILYSDGNGDVKHYTHKSLGGFYADLPGIILVDISDDTLGSRTFFHELIHAEIRQLRVQLDDMMYGGNKEDQREEIMVHYLTDLQTKQRALYDLSIRMNFIRDPQYNIKNIQIPKLTYTEANEDQRIVDSYALAGTTSNALNSIASAKNSGNPIIKKSKNRTVRQTLNKRPSDDDVPNIFTNSVDSTVQSYVSKYLSHKSKFTNRRK